MMNSDNAPIGSVLIIIILLLSFQYLERFQANRYFVNQLPQTQLTLDAKADSIDTNCKNGEWATNYLCGWLFVRNQEFESADQWLQQAENRNLQPLLGRVALNHANLLVQNGDIDVAVQYSIFSLRHERDQQNATIRLLENLWVGGEIRQAELILNESKPVFGKDDYLFLQTRHCFYSADWRCFDSNFIQLTKNSDYEEDALYLLTQKYFFLKDFYNAELVLLELIKKYPESVIAYGQIGNLYANYLSQPEKAKPYYRQYATQIEGAEKAKTLLSLIKISVKTKNYDQAEMDLQQIKENDLLSANSISCLEQTLTKLREEKGTIIQTDACTSTNN